MKSHGVNESQDTGHADADPSYILPCCRTEGPPYLNNCLLLGKTPSIHHPAAWSDELLASSRMNFFSIPNAKCPHGEWRGLRTGERGVALRGWSIQTDIDLFQPWLWVAPPSLRTDLYMGLLQPCYASNVDAPPRLLHFENFIVQLAPVFACG